MRIAKVEATLHGIPVEYPLIGKPKQDLVVLVRVETDAGLVGHSLLKGRDPLAVYQYIQNRFGPAIVGEDPRNTERVWHKLFWAFNQRARTGIVAEAQSGVDMALWDIKGQAAGMALWQLLGGSQDRIKVYATVNGPAYTEEEYVEVAVQKVAAGHRTIKIAVAMGGIGDLEDDVRKVKAIREAVGPDIGLAIDANCLLDLQSAARLARRVEQYHIAWFEEPVHNNEPSLTAQLRRMTSIPISAGQCEVFRWNFRDLVAGGQAYDLVQIDLGYVGGYTEAIKVAGLLQAHHLQFSTHGSPTLSMHLVGAFANGKTVECHLMPEGIDRTVFTSFPEPDAGYITLPKTPGIGIEWNHELLANTRLDPESVLNHSLRAG